ncbi:MAG: hypothetical protein ACE5FQ_01340 [Thiogranum sp.]
MTKEVGLLGAIFHKVKNKIEGSAKLERLTTTETNSGEQPSG